MRRQYTREQVEIWIELHRRGISARAIGQLCEVPGCSVRYHLIKCGENRGQVRLLDHEEAWRLYQTGVRQAEIARRFNVSPVTVHKALQPHCTTQVAA